MMDVPEKELLLQVRLKNNRAYTLRRARGLTQREVAKRTGVALRHICDIETFGVPRDGRRKLQYKTLRPRIERLAQFFGVSADDLLPQSLYDAIKCTTTELTIDKDDALLLAGTTFEELAALPAPSADGDPVTSLEEREVREACAAALAALIPRDAEALRLRFGIDREPTEWKGVGDHFGVTRERARQFTTKALRKLRRKPKRFEDMINRPEMGSGAEQKGERT